MEREAKKRLFDALEACFAVLAFVAQHTLEAFESNELLASAVERKLEIVGEALSQFRKLVSDAETTLPDLHRIVGLRNRLIHGYDDVSREMLWDIATKHVPDLTAQIEKLLEREILR